MIAAALNRPVFVPVSKEEAQRANTPHAWGETPAQLYENWMELRIDLHKQHDKEDEYMYARWLAEHEQMRLADAEGFMNIGY